jgi:multidrug efflux pump subunit AcrB
MAIIVFTYAAGANRLRAIAMTTLVAILALLSLALAIGESQIQGHPTLNALAPEP